MSGKKILIVSSCSKRGNSIGLIGGLINDLDLIDKELYSFDLCNIGYFQLYVPSDYKVRNYYGIEKHWIDKLIIKIPKIRSWVSKYKSIALVKKTLKREHYDLMFVFSLPSYSNVLVKIAHEYGTKTLLYPWGANDIIDKPEIYSDLYDAFSRTDYAMGIEDSNCSLAMQNIYYIELNKLILLKPKLNGISEIEKARLKYSRQECEKKLSIANGSCCVICGYNAFPDMLHEHILNSFYSIKDYLPENLLLVFPMTYPKNFEYVSHIKSLCKKYGFNSLFLTEYMNDEEMACLHLCSDYFINIQHADSGNAFQIEELFVGSKTITGSWLKYSQFEKFGIPYYKLETKKDLPLLLKDIFQHKIAKVEVPLKLKEYYSVPLDFNKGNYWVDLFNKMCL